MKLQSLPGFSNEKGLFQHPRALLGSIFLSLVPAPASVQIVSFAGAAMTPGSGFRQPVAVAPREKTIDTASLPGFGVRYFGRATEKDDADDRGASISSP